MHYEIELKNPLGGISLASFEQDEKIEHEKILVSDFVTDTEGEWFYTCLQTFENLFLKPFHETNFNVSVIDNYLVLMKENKANVYINELPLYFETIATTNLQKGQMTTSEDIVGVTFLHFGDMTIPDDCAIVFFFSIGWKRGLYFDFRPNSGEKLDNINYKLGMCYEHLQYSHLYCVKDDVWEKAYESGWFPFIALLGNADNLLKHFLSRIEDGKSTEASEKRLIEYFDENRLEQFRAKFCKNPNLQPHAPIIDVGIERYLERDYVSSINNVWPRIEGILRYIYSKAPKEQLKPLLENMADVVTNNTISPRVFFPQHFRLYLKKFFFKDFDLTTGRLSVSRHSIGHGVSNAAEYDAKHALLGILMVDQLSYYIQARAKNTTNNN